jgi:acetate---CoA ligase (ADP-forming)
MRKLSNAPEDVILRDGTTLRLRPPLAADADALLDFMSRLSDRSRYLRFHGFPHLAPGLVAPFLDPDWDERGALIGCLEGRIVALANFARLRDRRVAEIAFTVEDEAQGHGIATRMLERLAVLAAETGIEEFVAEVLPENRSMLLVFRDAGFDIARELDGGELEIRFPIAPTERLRDKVAERNHVAVTASLKSFFAPTCVAVIGASARRGSIGGELFRNILAADFAGAAYPVNRGGEPVAGVRGYTGVAGIPDRVELAVICVPGEHVLAAAQEALEAGVRALCVISAGFAEIGAEGRIRQEQLLALAREHGARLVGPNCLGIASAAARLNATFAPRAFPAGTIGFSSQSGALGLAVLERAEARGLGLSSFVSIGNKADVSSNDLLEWWEDDPATEIVMLYLESFGNSREFARIAQRVARTKPILAVKGGTTQAGIKAASSHTAALASSETAVDALFRQAGVIRTRTLDELVDVASLLAAQPVPRGRRVALLTNAGGLGILCADACSAAGLELPALSESTRRALAEVMPPEGSVANPVDMLGSANAKSFRNVLPLVLADPGIDAVIVLFVPTVGVDEDEVGAAISTAAAAAGDKTVLCAFLSAKGAPASLRSAAPVPSFSYPEAAARALGRAAERGDWLRRPAGTIPELDADLDAAQAVVAEALGSSDDAWLEPAQARLLLEA